MLPAELIQQEADDALVEVVSAQVVVAGGREDLDRIAVDIQDADVERAAAEIEDHDLAGLPFVEAVGEGRRGRLIDDAADGEPGNHPGVPGGLALGIGKIGGDRDHRVGNRLADVCLRVGLQLAEDHGGDFLRGVGLSVHIVAFVGSHFALDGREGAGRVGHRLALGRHADQAFPVFRERDDGRGRPPAFGIRDDNGTPVFHKTDTGIGRSQVNTDQN